MIPIIIILLIHTINKILLKTKAIFNRIENMGEVERKKMKKIRLRRATLLKI